MYYRISKSRYPTFVSRCKAFRNVGMWFTVSKFDSQKSRMKVQNLVRTLMSWWKGCSGCGVITIQIMQMHKAVKGQTKISNMRLGIVLVALRLECCASVMVSMP